LRQTRTDMIQSDCPLRRPLTFR